MPQPVAPWAGTGWPSAKSMNIAMYSADGTALKPNGVLFQSLGRLFLESGGSVTLASATSAAGHRNILTGTVTSYNGFMALDSAGYFNATSDGTPYSGAYYRYLPAVPGSSGTMTAAGGIVLAGHVCPVSTTATQEAVGAGFAAVDGARQKSNGSFYSIPFCLDLTATQGGTITPSVTITDSASAAAATVSQPPQTDLSGALPRFQVLWAGPETAQAAAYGTLPSPSPQVTWTSGSTVTAALMNGTAGIAGALNFLNSAPLLRAHGTAAQSVPNTVPSLLAIGTVSADIDPYAGWSGTASTWTAPRDGIYLLHGVAPWSPNATGQRMAGIAVNGTIFWGPGYQAATVAGVGSTKTQMFSLLAGDTVRLYGWQNSGGALTLDSARQAYLLGAWLGAPGTAATSFEPPDPTFRWQAGTPGPNLPALFTQHAGQDLAFLTWRPYLLAWQGTAQSGFANNASPQIVMDTFTGLIHGDNTDPWAGWAGGTVSAWAAPKPGWYLLTGELTATVPSTTTSCQVTAAAHAATSGGRTPASTTDQAQGMFASTSAAAPAGATLLGLYYLAQGEQISFWLFGGNYTATTWGTSAHGTVSSGITGPHAELIWVGS